MAKLKQHVVESLNTLSSRIAGAPMCIKLYEVFPADVRAALGSAEKAWENHPGTIRMWRAVYDDGGEMAFAVLDIAHRLEFIEEQAYQLLWCAVETARTGKEQLQVASWTPPEYPRK